MNNNSPQGQSSSPRGAESPAKPCPSCSCNDVTLFHRVSQIPVNSVLNIGTRDEALQFPRGDLALGFCRHCGFIYNSVFDPRLVEYSAQCEESQGYSPTFSAFARELATALIEKHNLRNRRIVEIGCGKGEFLDLICSLGDNVGVGFDPAYVPDRFEFQARDRLTFIRDFYSDEYAECNGDMICCRMTLEHIDDTANLVSLVRRSIGNQTDTIVFFQVPDVTRILRECAFEDIYYEHCSYFSPGSLARLFRSNDFEVIDLQTAYDGQYILMEAKPVVEAGQSRLELEGDLESLSECVEHFRRSCLSIVEGWEEHLANFHRNEHKVVIWGSGSKGVAFLNTLRNTSDIEYVVDINPHRQGTYMAGTGQLIVDPDFLTECRPDVVIVMNRIYEDEIQRDLRRLDLHPLVFSLGDLSRQGGRS